MPSNTFAPDDFVSRIVRDPSNPPATLLLRGFLGEAPEPEQIRVYLDAELSRFVDAPREAVLHVQPIPAEHNLLGGRMVWLRRDAPLIRGQVADGAAPFLEGDAYGYPAPPREPARSASRRPVELSTDYCDPDPPPTDECATSLSQTCMPQTQPGYCYAPEEPRGMPFFGTAAPPRVTPMVSAETVQRCHT